MTAQADPSRPVLYHYWRSSSSWRVRWALELKDIAYQAVAVDLLAGEQRSAEHLLRNPLATVPVLYIEGQYLGESVAILEYLEEVYPQAPLLPSRPLERARVRQLCQIIVADTQPLQNLSVLEHVEKLSGSAEVRKKWIESYIIRGLDAYETLLKKPQGGSASGPYSCGAAVTLADLCLIPQCMNARRFGLDLGRWPKIAAVEAACLGTEAAQRSHPEKWKPQKT